MPDEIISDATGRKLLIRELKVMDQTRLLRAAGPAQSGNMAYFHMVECAAMVREIDGVPCPFPINERMIDAAIAALDDEGMSAVMVLRTTRMNDMMKAAEQAVAQSVAQGEKPAGPLAPSAS